MTCPTHTPVVTTDPEGNYMRTSCRACGMLLMITPDPLEAFDQLPIVDAPAPKKRGRKPVVAAE